MQDIKVFKFFFSSCFFPFHIHFQIYEASSHKTFYLYLLFLCCVLIIWILPNRSILLVLYKNPLFSSVNHLAYLHSPFHQSLPLPVLRSFLVTICCWFLMKWNCVQKIRCDTNPIKFANTWEMAQNFYECAACLRRM